MSRRMKFGVPVTLQVTPEQFKHLENKAIRRIRLGEDETNGRHSVTKELRALIDADMEALK